MQRELGQSEISWALDIDQLIQEVATQDLPSVIVELSPKSIVDDCDKVLLASRHLPQTRFFAVGGAQLRSWLPLILTCGFAGCCRSAGGLPKLVSLVRFVEKSRFQEKETIEEKVLKGLPWKPARQI